MKKIGLLLVVLCVAVSVNAQVYVGGTAGFWKNSDAELTAFEISPEIGYNINEKWAVGAELGYQNVKVGDHKSNAYILAPYARYTYCEAGIVRLFLDGTVAYASGKEGDADRVNGFQAGLVPGVAIKLNDTFSLITKVGFLGYRDDFGVAAEEGFDKGFGLALDGNDLSVGFIVNF